MGAEFFVTTGHGMSVDDAFKKAVEQALWDHGHSGYSGTLAEKGGCNVLFVGTIPEGADYFQEGYDRIDHPSIQDKWHGDVGVLRIGNTDKYVFFGWASS